MFENKAQGERGGLVVECWTLESTVPGFNPHCGHLRKDMFTPGSTS